MTIKGLLLGIKWLFKLSSRFQFHHKLRPFGEIFRERYFRIEWKEEKKPHRYRNKEHQTLLQIKSIHYCLLTYPHTTRQDIWCLYSFPLNINQTQINVSPYITSVYCQTNLISIFSLYLLCFACIFFLFEIPVLVLIIYVQSIKANPICLARMRRSGIFGFF
jgi:hypothetical protein